MADAYTGRGSNGEYQTNEAESLAVIMCNDFPPAKLDVNGTIFFASPNARSALSRVGFDKELEQENLGELFAKLPKSKNEPTDEYWQTLLSGKFLRRAEYENSKGVIDLLVIPITNANDRIGAIVLVHNITELRNRDRALITKDATIKEIHHRVKNNLQTVSALLRLQSRRVEDLKARGALEEAVRRISSIALVHETLSSSGKDEVDFDSVVDSLIGHAVELALRAPGSTHEIAVKRLGSIGSLNPKIATPLSLIITELVANAIEHGITTRGNKVDVIFSRTGSSCVVKIEDNGVGLPSNFDLKSKAAVAKDIVNTIFKISNEF